MANTSPSTLRRLGVLGATGTLATGSVAALLTALAVTPAAAATTYTVDDASDGVANAADCTDGTPGNCSLRDANAAANDGDTIDFAAGISSITLTQGMLLTNAIDILGPGSAALTITTTDVAGAYDTFLIRGTGDATISGMKLTKNRIYADNAGDFTLDDVIVEDSKGQRGGGLYLSNDGDALVSNAQFNRNIASSRGGAVAVYNIGTATISDTIADGNSANNGGGGIFVGSALLGDFSLLRSTISGNSATWGGGLYTDNGGDVLVEDTLIDGNDALVNSGGGGYISHDGDLIIMRSSIMGNQAKLNGGGLYISGDVSGSTIIDSTFFSNAAEGSGGAIFLSGSNPLIIANSTLTGNSALGKGGALYLVDNSLYLLQSTITQNTANTGGGLYVEGTSAIVLTGSILAGNTAAGVGSVPAANFDDLSGNGDSIDSKNSILGTIGTPDSFTLTDLGGTIRTDDPGVEVLADNGGPTMTMALVPTSPAIDAGPDPVPPFAGNDFDQRGAGYARVAYGRADIGAYEIQEPPAPEPEPVVPAFTG